MSVEYLMARTPRSFQAAVATPYGKGSAKPTRCAPYLGVADDGLARIIGEQLDALLPLVHVVGVLAEEDGAHLLRVRETIRVFGSRCVHEGACS